MSRVATFFYLQPRMCTSSSANSLLRRGRNTLDGAALGESQARLTRLLMPSHNPTRRLTLRSSKQGTSAAAKHSVRHARTHKHTSTSKYTHTHTHKDTHTHLNTHTYTKAITHAHISIHTHTHTHTKASTRTQTHIKASTHAQEQSNTHTHTQLHTDR